MDLINYTPKYYLLWLVVLVFQPAILLFSQPDPGIFIPNENRKYFQKVPYDPKTEAFKPYTLFGDTLKVPSPFTRSILFSSSPDLNSQRQLRNINLSPGHYRFRGQAFNNEGGIKEEGRTIEFRILPPLWQSWWASSLYAALVVAIVLAIWRYELNRHLARAEARRLKDLDQIKSKLYANITHEFRTPLTVISGMADQVLDHPEYWFRDGLEMIKRNSQLLLNLVNHMLELSKLESGTLEVNMIQGDIIHFLKYLTESFHSYAETRDIRLHLLPELEELFMDFDPEKMQTIFSNLVDNAIKFTPDGGNVYIAVINTQVPVLGDSMVLKVKDRGVGISEAQLPYIFDWFFQVGPDSYRGTTRKGEGIGIGLALTKELVKLLGGCIEVCSKQGEGTEFMVSLPIRRKAEKRIAVPTLSGEVPTVIREAVSELRHIDLPGSNEELPLALLIEDNKDVLEYLGSCLQGQYRLEKAGNGKEGIEKAIEIVPDIIISDVMMSETDSFEVVATLKKNERTNHIPIILLTAKADQDSIITGLNMGADACLAKPFNQQELEVHLRNLIEVRRKLQARYNSLVPTLAGQNHLPDKESYFLQRVQVFVEEHLGDQNFGISQLCRALGISRAQLHKKLKVLTGRSTSQVIRTIRMHKAKELLENTSLNISEVGYAVGFPNLSYFSQVFKEEFGKAPSNLRKEK